MVIVLDGTGEITIGEEKYLLGAGETIIMPAASPTPFLQPKGSRCF